MSVARIRDTGRFSALVILALFVCALGVLTGNGVILVSAIAPLGYLLYGQLTTLPVSDVTVTRALGDENPAPGSEVEVRLTVTNTGNSTLPKLQIVDGVPSELGVVDGSPRLATALMPGESTTLTYSVVAKRGEHDFGEVYLNVQGFSGTDEREQGERAGGETTLRCHAAVAEPVEREVTHQYAGQVTTEEGGTGLEFYATREHQHGDPVNRIDWNRYAKEGELTTIEYREQKGAPVVICVDLRSEIDVARRAVDPPASELNIYAAHRLLEPLLRYGTEVGLVFFTHDSIEWLPPGRGEGFNSRALLAFREAGARNWSENTVTLRKSALSSLRHETAPASTVADGSGAYRAAFESLEERLPASANLILITPIVDSLPEEAASYFSAFGYAVTVLGPNVIQMETPGGRTAALDRELSITKLRRTGTKTVSWNPDDSLGKALSQTLEGQL